MAECNEADQSSPEEGHSWFSGRMARAETGGFKRRTFLGASFAAVSAFGLSATTVSAASAAVLVGAEAPASEASADFTHPGILHRAEDLDRMRQAVAAKQSPIYDGYLAMASNGRSSLSYAQQNTGQVTSYGRGPNVFAGQGVSDSTASYQLALMWVVTGDMRYADKSRDIMNTWASSLSSITGADGQLGTGLLGFKFANAAEILLHSGYNGWPAEQSGAFIDSLRTVWYPSLSGYALFANGNWDNAAVQTVLAIAVLSDDRVMFDEAIRYLSYGGGNGAVRNRIINAAGQTQESGRDQAHEQLAQGLLAYCAQVAWNQGIDLFGAWENRILAGYEYDARYNLFKDDLSFVADLDKTAKYLKTAPGPNSRGQFRPIYELGYGHYVSRLGLSAPNVQSVIFRGSNGARVVEGGHDDDPGWGTLTYARPAGGVATPAMAPGTPGGIRVEGYDDRVMVSWVSSVEPRSGAAAQNYVVKRATSAEGAYETIATEVRGTEFEDRNVTRGQWYSYVLQAVNPAGSSTDSAPVSGTAGLPDGWQAADIGSPALAGSTFFDGERFTFDDSGRDIGGTADSFRFAYRELDGDGVLTARIVHPLTSQYAKVGLMVRSSLDADSAHASLLIQGLPLYTWSGVWSTRSARGGATSGTGSTLAPPTQAASITTKAAFPIANHGSLPDSATPLPAPYVEAASDGYRFRMPYWVRLVRRGKTLTGSISPDGRQWTEVGSSEIELGGMLYAGVAACSCLGDMETGTSVVDNVTVGSWTTSAPRTAARDLTAVAGDGAVVLKWSDPDLSARYVVRRGAEPQAVRLTVATDVGAVGFGTQIRFADAAGLAGQHYYYTVSKVNAGGEGPVSAVVDSVLPPQASVTLQGATEAFGNVGVSFSYMVKTDEPVGYFSARDLPEGLRIDRSTGVISGVPVATGASTVTVLAGKTSGKLKITIGNAREKPWSYTDIGDYVLDERQLGIYGLAAIRTPGITSYADDKFIVRGAGTSLNLNGQGIAAHVAHQQLSGDKVITARLAERHDAGSADRVGVIMSKTLNPFDLMAAAVTAPTGRGEFLRRSVVAGKTVTTAGSSGSWVRLERKGNVFTASVSADGSAWTVLAQDTLSDFGDAPYVAGLVVCSGDPFSLNTTVFDRVNIA